MKNIYKAFIISFVSSFIREFDNNTITELKQLGYNVEQYDEFLFVRW